MTGETPAVQRAAGSRGVAQVMKVDRGGHHIRGPPSGKTRATLHRDANEIGKFSTARRVQKCRLAKHLSLVKGKIT
jgi:hypothetical protein